MLRSRSAGRRDSQGGVFAAGLLSGAGGPGSVVLLPQFVHSLCSLLQLGEALAAHLLSPQTPLLGAQLEGEHRVRVRP